MDATRNSNYLCCQFVGSLLNRWPLPSIQEVLPLKLLLKITHRCALLSETLHDGQSDSGCLRCLLGWLGDDCGHVQ